MKHLHLTCLALVLAAGGARALESGAVVNIGPGCGAGEAPRLTVSPDCPTASSTLEFAAIGLTPGSVGSLFANFGTTEPLELGSGCALYPWPVGMLPAQLVIVDGFGEWGFSAHLTGNPAFSGVTLTFQAITFGTAAPLGADFTNGVRVTIQ